MHIDRRCIALFAFCLSDINPWLNVDCSAMSSRPAKTRSLTSQKIDINRGNSKTMRVQGIAPFVDAEIRSQTVRNN